MKKVALIICFLGILGFSLNTQAQTISEKNIISGSIMGTSSYIGVTYERLLSDEVSVELGIGIISIGFGATYFPWKIKEDDFNFYTGLKYNSPNVITAAFLIPGRTNSQVYIPIGFNYPFDEGLTIAIDFGPNLNGQNAVFGNLKVGYRF